MYSLWVLCGIIYSLLRSTCDYSNYSESESRLVVPDSLQPDGLWPAGSSVHGESPGKHTGVGCHALLQGIFPTQGWNPGLPH